MTRRTTLSGRRAAALSRKHAFGAAAKRCVALALVFALPACTFTLGGNPNAADEVRAENLKLKKQVDELSTKLELRTGEIDALRQQQEAGAVPMPGAETPVFSKLVMDRYSGAIDTDKSGKDDLVRIYVKTLDQQGRFMPVAGRGVIQVVLIRPDAEPQVLVETTYEPAELDAAYRTGITGTHYTLEARLPDDLPDGTIDATTVFTFTQADTGVEMSTQAATRIDR